MVVFFAAGSRTPLLALLALRRFRNLALVALPYGLGIGLVAALGPALPDADRAGLLAGSIAPALLSAPALAVALGGRMDRAGALLAGTIAAAFGLTMVRGGAAAGALQNGMLALIVGAAVLSVIPLLPSAIRSIVQRAGDLALLALLAVGVIGGPRIELTTVLAALALVGGTAAVAAVVARLVGVDPRSAVAGAGTRDPAVAIAVALAIGGPAAAGVPLCLAAWQLVLGAVLVAWNRRKAR